MCVTDWDTSHIVVQKERDQAQMNTQDDLKGKGGDRMQVDSDKGAAGEGTGGNDDSLPHQPLAQIDISEFSEVTRGETLLQDWITETLQTLSVRIDLTSDDYREFVELCMVFIGCRGSIAFMSPKAIHKAR